MNHDEEENINYWKEFVTSQSSLMGFVGSIGVGALLSVAITPGFALIPPLLFLSGGAVASMFIPTSVLYQEHIRSKKRKEKYERIEKEMITILREKSPNAEEKWMQYWKLKEQWETMKKWSKQGGALAEYEINSFENSILSYLQMWCSLESMKESSATIDVYSIERKIESIDDEISKAQGVMSQKQLKQAQMEYKKILSRHQDLKTRTIAIEAKMVSLVHGFEEIYQRLISGQLSSSTDIQDALKRLRIEEELDMAVDFELNDLSQPVSKKKKKKKQQQAQSRKI